MNALKIAKYLLAINSAVRNSLASKFYEDDIFSLLNSKSTDFDTVNL